MITMNKLEKMTKAQLIDFIGRLSAEAVQRQMMEDAEAKRREIEERKQEKTYLPPNFRAIKRYMVTEVVTKEGSGVKDDFARLVYWIYDDKGNCITVNDIDGYAGDRFRAPASNMED